MAELQAVLLARDLRDGEKAIVGTNSDVQVAACNLARCRQAPTLWWVSGPGGMVNCNEPVIRSTARTENIAWSEAMMDLPQMVDFIDWKIHFFDFAILGAIQVDRFGNINTVCVGPHDKPRLRGPGTVGISALTALARRFYVVMARHDRGSFPERVDFLNGPGFLDGGTSRTDRGLPEGGPEAGAEPVRHFRFRAGVETNAREVAAIRASPSSRFKRQTGFELLVEGTPPVTSMPTADELRDLRENVDSTGVLRERRRA